LSRRFGDRSRDPGRNAGDDGNGQGQCAACNERPTRHWHDVRAIKSTGDPAGVRQHARDHRGGRAFRVSQQLFRGDDKVAAFRMGGLDRPGSRGSVAGMRAWKEDQSQRGQRSKPNHGRRKRPRAQPASDSKTERSDWQADRNAAKHGLPEQPACDGVECLRQSLGTGGLMRRHG
jgi:hypothetical protein